MEKRRIITSYEKLSPELKQVVLMQYPDGYQDAVRKIDKPNGDFFYAFDLVTEDTNYMVKIQLQVDEKIEEIEDNVYGSESNEDSSDSKMVEFDDNEMYDD
jgi:hypothetical protein